jgi:hypothetical protein
MTPPPLLPPTHLPTGGPGPGGIREPGTGGDQIPQVLGSPGGVPRLRARRVAAGRSPATPSASAYPISHLWSGGDVHFPRVLRPNRTNGFDHCKGLTTFTRLVRRFVGSRDLNHHDHAGSLDPGVTRQQKATSTLSDIKNNREQ